jgi:hypothetical protein
LTQLGEAAQAIVDERGGNVILWFRRPTGSKGPDQTAISFVLRRLPIDNQTVDCL